MSQFPGVSGTYFHGNYGYPFRGNPRRLKPSVLLVSHITGNSNLPSALAEMQYSARAGSGASFTFAINRNGTIVQGLHPETQSPWTNGDLTSPNVGLTTVRAMVGSAFNANEFCFMTAECVGYEPGNPVTNEQVASLAALAKWGSGITGLPITRGTLGAMLGHRDINSVTRFRCPTTGDLNVFIDRIVALASETDVPFIEKYEEWIAAPGTPFWTDGPGTGPQKVWNGGPIITVAESADNLWRIARYQDSPTAPRELLYFRRKPGLTPKVPGGDPVYDGAVVAAIERRTPAPDCTAAEQRAREATAAKAEAQTQAWVATRPPIAP